MLPAESSTRIMWQPTVSPPRWQGKAPLCRDSSRGPGYGCSLHAVALLDSIWIDKWHQLSLPTGKWAQLPFFGPASHWNPQSGWHFQSVMLAIESALPGVTVTERDDLSILGAPIDINGCRTGVPKAEERLSTMSSRLESNDAHHASFLLRNCLSMPRLLFKLRCSPCYRLHAELTQFDKTLRQAASTVCNVNFDDTGWQQSTLPVAQGGLGLSSAVNVSYHFRFSKTFLNLARHLKLTQSLNIGLNLDTN